MVSEDERDMIRRCMEALRQGLPGFQTRRAQLEMIAAVANALASCREENDAGTSGRNITLCQCGTGTGKSIGGVLPALVMARSRGKRLVVSSSTIALQHQYSDKDIPTLQRLLPLAFSFAVAKGRGRYACTAKLFAAAEEARQRDLALDEAKTPASDAQGSEPRNRKDVVHLAQRFESGQWSGDRDALRAPVADALWSRLTTDRQGCSGSRCPHFAKCPFYTARQRVKEADLIIANHDLVLSALEMEAGSVLPEVSNTFYILDEGHSLTSKVIEHFAAKHGVHGAVEWLRGTAQCVRDIVLGLRLEQALYRDASTSCKQLAGELDDLYRAIERTGAFEDKTTRRFKNGVIPHWARMSGENVLAHAVALQKTLAAVREQMLEKAGSEAHLVTRLMCELGVFTGKLENLVDTWRLMLADDSGQWAPTARWIEKHVDGKHHDYLICASPISGGEKLRKLLWNRASAVVVTSATLTSCDSFGLYLKQTGLSVFPEVRTLRVDSPFDYRANATLVVPPMKSDPTNANAHSDEIVARLPRLIHSRGTLVLFASGKQMREVHARLPEDLKRVTLMQGALPKMEMLSRHKRAIDAGDRSVLFGLGSLAEGVDLPGEYCTHVIVAKLPFSVPDSPLEEARSEWIISQGGSPFLEMVLPQTSVRLQQEVGRLLRTVEDYGTVTILDRRIVTKRWGRTLLKGLPDFNLVIGKEATHPSITGTL